MTHSFITPKAALANLTIQVDNVKQSALLTTAACIMTLIAHTSHVSQDDKEALNKARDTVRETFIARGMVREINGTKQINTPATRIIAAAMGAVTFKRDAFAKLMLKHQDVADQTSQIAALCASFALSNNHNQGGVYLMPLTTGKSKKACLALIHERNNAANQEEGTNPANVTNKVAASRTTAPKIVATEAQAKAVLSTAATVTSVLSSLKDVVRVGKGATPSNVTSAAVVKLFSDLDAVCRLIRGESIKASKDVAQLAVEVVKHYEAFKKNASKQAKKQAIETKAEKKAA